VEQTRQSKCPRYTRSNTKQNAEPFHVFRRVKTALVLSLIPTSQSVQQVHMPSVSRQPCQEAIWCKDALSALPLNLPKLSSSKPKNAMCLLKIQQYLTRQAANNPSCKQVSLNFLARVTAVPVWLDSVVSRVLDVHQLSPETLV